MVEQAIQMAVIPAPMYHKMQSVFTLFEEGKLKGQKPQQTTGVTLQKALEEKLAPKLSQLRCSGIPGTDTYNLVLLYT